MPELPDLEIFKTNVFHRLTSRQLVGVTVYNSRKMTTPQQFLADALVGRTLLGIDRIGKELFFNFGDTQRISVHLMLNGTISIVPESAVDAIKFKIFSLSFPQETVVFSDRGGLCTVKYKPPVNNIPDAFDAGFTLDYFLGIARKKPSMNIKAFLIDQHIVKGIGNAYADEILWAARISPYSLVGKIPQEQLAVLYRAIGLVLHGAVKALKRITPDSISGEERSFLKVHNKSLEKTQTGYPIIVEKVASKITYYTKEQIFY